MEHVTDNPRLHAQRSIIKLMKGNAIQCGNVSSNSYQFFRRSCIHKKSGRTDACNDGHQQLSFTNSCFNSNSFYFVFSFMIHHCGVFVNKTKTFTIIKIKSLMAQLWATHMTIVSVVFKYEYPTKSTKLNANVDQVILET